MNSSDGLLGLLKQSITLGRAALSQSIFMGSTSANCLLLELLDTMPVWRMERREALTPRGHR
jgi:hypothetical protein